MRVASLSLEFDHDRPTIPSSRAVLADSVFQIDAHWNFDKVANKQFLRHFPFPLRPVRFRQWCLTARKPRRVEVERDGRLRPSSLSIATGNGNCWNINDLVIAVADSCR
jgi:hypothetical protein